MHELQVLRSQPHPLGDAGEPIVYGQAPEGLQVALGPAPLQPGRAYYIAVMGDSGWGREAKGTCSFTLDEAGNVHTEPGC